jgi:cyclopropane fatty-acyl-phospholipid synthase-like methyltransferase
MWEYYLGVKTRGTDKCAHADGVAYEPNPYHVIRTVLANLDLQADDVFADIGCGKGRVLCCAARWRLQKLIGIEVQPHLLEIARRNLAHVRGALSPVDLHAAPAEEFDYTGVTAVYMFHPFGPETMRRVLLRLAAAAASRARPLRVAYTNSAHDNVIAAAGWLKLRQRWPPSKFAGMLRPVSFWQSD